MKTHNTFFYYEFRAVKRKFDQLNHYMRAIRRTVLIELWYAIYQDYRFIEVLSRVL